MKPKNLIPLLSLAVIWGTYYVASNKAVESMSVFNVGIVIRLLTMLFLTAIMLKKGELRQLLQTRGVRFRLFLIGLMGFLLDYTAFVGLQLSASAGLGTALLKTDILFVNLISVILYRQHFSRREWLYTFVMLFGVLMVMGLGLSSLSQIDPSCLFFILSALFVSINAFLIKSVQRSPVNPVSNRVIAYYNNFITMLFFLATAAAMQTLNQFARIGSSRPLALALLVAGLGQTLVYIVYYYNLSHFPVWLVKVFLLFMPVVSSVISFVLFDELLSSKQIVGMLVVLIGALGILVEQRRKEAGELANQM